MQQRNLIKVLLIIVCATGLLTELVIPIAIRGYPIDEALMYYFGIEVSNYESDRLVTYALETIFHFALIGGLAVGLMPTRPATSGGPGMSHGQKSPMAWGSHQGEGQGQPPTR